jgi:hypothetical protein
LALKTKIAGLTLALSLVAITVLCGALFVLERKGASLETGGPGLLVKLGVVLGVIIISFAQRHVAARSGRKEANL